MKKLEKSTGDFHAKLQRFLLYYRTTPQTMTGMSPAELLFSWNLKTKLNFIHIEIRMHVQKNWTTKIDTMTLVFLYANLQKVIRWLWKKIRVNRDGYSVKLSVKQSHYLMMWNFQMAEKEEGMWISWEGVNVTFLNKLTQWNSDSEVNSSDQTPVCVPNVTTPVRQPEIRSSAKPMARTPRIWRSPEYLNDCHLEFMEQWSYLYEFS